MSPMQRPPQRQIGGLWCRDVLECLPDYLDGSLDPELCAAAEAHLAGCDWCARFGGRYAGLVDALRRELAPAEPLPEGLAGRLDAWLDRTLG